MSINAAGQVLPMGKYLPSSLRKICKRAKHPCRLRREEGGWHFRKKMTEGAHFARFSPSTAKAVPLPQGGLKGTQKPIIKVSFVFYKLCLCRKSKLCTNFPIIEVSFAYFSFQRKVRCLLFFSKKSRSVSEGGADCRCKLRIFGNNEIYAES